LAADELEQLAANYNLFGKSYKSVKQAYAAARKQASKDDMIYIGGSIFVVAEVL
jgi:dihydrofolate synthase/folylpolyglutamate synthase